MTTQTTIRTSSLSVAAYLMCEGFEPIRTEKTNDGKSTFWVFDNEDNEAMSYVQDYDHGYATVNPKEHNDYVVQLKRSLFT